MVSQDSSLADLLSDLEARLLWHSDTSRLDAQVLLAHITGKPRSWILAHPEGNLNPEQYKSFLQATERLERGEPLPYVLGHWEFYGLDFLVTPNVLIPRPETELLVEHALDWLSSRSQPSYVADIGTGSGCIAITLAAKIPSLRLFATDISLSALEIARANAQRYNVTDRIEFVQADLLEFANIALFDVICANLPYIPTNNLPSLTVTHYEPSLALDGGADGLDLIRRILHRASHHLAPDGLMLLEIEASQGSKAISLAQSTFPNSRSRIHPDLAGRDHLLSIIRN